MKKVLSFIIALITAVVTFAVPVYADSVIDDIGDYIVYSLENYQQGIIDIEKYVNKYGWTKKQTSEVITSVMYSHPELFFIKEGFLLHSEYNKVCGVSFEYTMSRSERTAARNKMDAAAKKAIAGITSGMNDVDKALYIHDYIIQNCRYDFNHKKYNAYNCLVENSCVCQGFSLAYSYILNNYLGIKCTVAYSDAQNHIWNYVKIGNNWYHVDLTLDDWHDTDGNSMYDRYGGIYHDNFLMSDTKCRSTSSMHNNWIIVGNYPAANDKSYDNAFWNGVNSAIYYDNGNYYYIVEGAKEGKSHVVQVFRYNRKSQTATKLAKLNTAWYKLRNANTGETFPYGKKIYSEICSSIVLMNGKLYFNSNKCVYSYDLSTKAVKKVFTLDKGEEMQIFSMVKYGDKIRIAYRKDTTYPETYMKLVFA